jgi:hypothetical protein
MEMHYEKEEKKGTKELHRYRKYVPENIQVDMSLQHEASCGRMLQGAVAEGIEQPIVNGVKKAELLTSIDAVFLLSPETGGIFVDLNTMDMISCIKNPRNRRAKTLLTSIRSD